MREEKAKKDDKVPISVEIELAGILLNALDTLNDRDLDVDAVKSYSQSEESLNVAEKHLSYIKKQYDDNLDMWMKTINMLPRLSPLIKRVNRLYQIYSVLLLNESQEYVRNYTVSMVYVVGLRNRILSSANLTSEEKRKALSDINL